MAKEYHRAVSFVLICTCSELTPSQDHWWRKAAKGYIYNMYCIKSFEGPKSEDTGAQSPTFSATYNSFNPENSKFINPESVIPLFPINYFTHHMTDMKPKVWSFRKRVLLQF